MRNIEFRACPICGEVSKTLMSHYNECHTDIPLIQFLNAYHGYPKCPECGSEVQQDPHHPWRKRIFCSRSCQVVYKNKQDKLNGRYTYERIQKSLDTRIANDSLFGGSVKMAENHRFQRDNGLAIFSKESHKKATETQRRLGIGFFSPTYQQYLRDNKKSVYAEGFQEKLKERKAWCYTEWSDERREAQSLRLRAKWESNPKYRNLMCRLASKSFRESRIRETFSDESRQLELYLIKFEDSKTGIKYTKCGTSWSVGRRLNSYLKMGYKFVEGIYCKGSSKGILEFENEIHCNNSLNKTLMDKRYSGIFTNGFTEWYTEDQYGIIKELIESKFGSVSEINWVKSSLPTKRVF